MTQAECYLKMLELTRRASPDASYQAAFYLLSTDSELCKIACRYIDSDGISFTGIKRATRDFDDKTKQVVDIAHNLFSWNSTCAATPHEIAQLGYPYMEQACNALQIASCGMEVVLRQDKGASPELVLDNSAYQRTKSIYRQLEKMQESAMERAGLELDDECER